MTIGRFGLIWIVVALLVGPAGGGTTFGSAARFTSTCTPKWRLVSTGGPALSDVEVVSAHDVWAIGTQYGKHVAVRLASRPRLVMELAGNGRLTGIAAVSSKDVWVVAETGVFHWNGRRWQSIAIPLSEDGRLSDVAATATDVWLVGSHGGPNVEDTLPLLIRRHDKRWSVVDLRGLALAASDLTAVDAAAPDDVWAAGTTGFDESSSYGFSDQVLRWDGHRWHRVSSPLQHAFSGPYPQALDVGRSRDVWTVNEDMSGNDPWFVHWSGAARAVARTGVILQSEYPLSLSTADIAGISRSGAWVVGTTDTDAQDREVRTPLVGRWDGKSWAAQPTPFDTLRNKGLKAIDALSAAEIWAVGNQIVIRYSC